MTKYEFVPRKGTRAVSKEDVDKAILRLNGSAIPEYRIESNGNVYTIVSKIPDSRLGIAMSGLGYDLTLVSAL